MKQIIKDNLIGLIAMLTIAVASSTTYAMTTWHTGDAVTADQWNKLRTAVMDGSTKNKCDGTWHSGHKTGRTSARAKAPRWYNATQCHTKKYQHQHTSIQRRCNA